MGKIAGFTAKEKDEILKQALFFWDDSTEAWRTFYDYVNENERLARILLPQELEDAYAMYPDRSSLVPPDIYNNLNSLRAIVRTGLFKKKPFFRLAHPGQNYIRDDRIEKAETTLQMNMALESDGKGFESEADKTVYQALYAGRTVVYHQWKKYYNKIPRRDNNGYLVKTDRGRVAYDQVLAYECAETVSLDIRRCRWPRAAAEPKDIRLVGYHSLMQYSDLQVLNRNPNSHYEFNEKKLWETALDRTKYFEFDESEADTYNEKADDSVAVGDKPIEVMSLRGLFRFEKSDGAVEFRDLIVEIGNRSILLACKDNDLPLDGWELFDWPAVDEQHGRFFPMGVVEAGRDTFVESFIKLNQSIDSANRNTYLTMFGDSAACENIPEYIETSNDVMYKIDVASAGLSSVQAAVDVLNRPQLGQDTFMQAQALSQVLQQTMRMNDYTQGLDPSRGETATGVLELTSGAGRLTDHLMERLSDTFFKPAIRKKLILWNFFKGHEAHLMYNRMGIPLQINPLELNFPVNVSIETNISSSSVVSQRRFVEVYSLISQDPYYDPLVVRETLNEVLDLPNKDRLLPPNDYLQMIVDRENSALGYGIELPVHPMDNHTIHIEGHEEYLQYIESLPEPRRVEEELTAEALLGHIEDHYEQIQMQEKALGNTKEMGGNTGTTAMPTGGALKGQPTRSGGSYLPSEGRA